MGTHPIFESDFDCLTVLEFKNATVAEHGSAEIIQGLGYR